MPDYENPRGEIIQVDETILAVMDAYFLPGGEKMRLLPAAAYDAFDPGQLRAWCSRRSRYGLPTVELIGWLIEKIAGRRAIEVCAGMGDLGRLLGIPMTDSHGQVENPEVRAYYAALGQQPTRPPADVVKLDAENAARKMKPQVIIGSWVTEKWIEGDSAQGGNMFGPREDYLLERCETYIMVGNENVHGQKRLLRQPHETFKFPWVRSRAKDQTKNVIYLWNNPNWR